MGYLFFGLQELHGKTIGNAGDMAKEIAKRNLTCYYLNPFPKFSGKALLNLLFNRKITQENYHGVIELSANYTTLIGNNAALKHWPLAHKLLSKIIWTPVNKHIHDNDLKCIVDNEFIKSFYIKNTLNCQVIYYIRDYLLGVDYWKNSARYFEPMFIAKADTVLTNSPFYSDYALKHRTNHVHYIGQGVDLTTLLRQDISIKPLEYKSLQQPIALYIGLLSERRLDLKLLEDTCTSLKFDFVLIGPESDAFKASKLHTYSNVHFLGSKNFDELAGYLHYSTVCINPQVLNEITQGNYPRKLDEYLAFGKPVVQLNTKGVDVFKPLICTYTNKAEFLSAMHTAYRLCNDDAYIAAAKKLSAQHTWSNVIDDLFYAINK